MTTPYVSEPMFEWICPFCYEVFATPASSEAHRAVCGWHPTLDLPALAEETAAAVVEEVTGRTLGGAALEYEHPRVAPIILAALRRVQMEQP